MAARGEGGVVSGPVIDRSVRTPITHPVRYSPRHVASDLFQRTLPTRRDVCGGITPGTGALTYPVSIFFFCCHNLEMYLHE